MYFRNWVLPPWASHGLAGSHFFIGSRWLASTGIPSAKQAKAYASRPRPDWIGLTLPRFTANGIPRPISQRFICLDCQRVRESMNAFHLGPSYPSG